jgi:hypothetical protein
MPSQCEMLQNCGFFQNFRGHSDAMKQGWVSMFCRNLEKSETCARKKVRLKTGKPPADNMSPTGRLLEPQ